MAIRDRVEARKKIENEVLVLRGEVIDLEFSEAEELFDEINDFLMDHDYLHISEAPPATVEGRVQLISNASADYRREEDVVEFYNHLKQGFGEEEDFGKDESDLRYWKERAVPTILNINNDWQIEDGEDKDAYINYSLKRQMAGEGRKQEVTEFMRRDFIGKLETEYEGFTEGMMRIKESAATGEFTDKPDMAGVWEDEVFDALSLELYHQLHLTSFVNFTNLLPQKVTFIANDDNVEGLDGFKELEDSIEKDSETGLNKALDAQLPTIGQMNGLDREEKKEIAKKRREYKKQFEAIAQMVAGIKSEEDANKFMMAYTGRSFRTKRNKIRKKQENT